MIGVMHGAFEMIVTLVTITRQISAQFGHVTVKASTIYGKYHYDAYHIGTCSHARPNLACRPVLSNTYFIFRCYMFYIPD